MPSSLLGYSKAAATDLTTTAQAIALVADSAEASSEDYPSKAWAEFLHGTITSIAGGATSVLWFLAWDSTGDIPLTPLTTTSIVVGMTTATKGGIAAAIGVPMIRPTGVGTARTLYMVARTNVGTCTMLPRLYHRR